MNKVKDDIIYTWAQFDEDVDYLTNLIENNDKFDVIIGLKRGGSVLATALAYALNIENVEYFDPNDWRSFRNYISSDKCLKYLIVDDINDTGNTLKKIKSYISGYPHDVKYAVIFNKTSSVSVVDFYAREIAEKDYGKWVKFCWEYEN